MKVSKFKLFGFSLIFFGLILPLFLSIVGYIPTYDNFKQDGENRYLIEEIYSPKLSYISDSYPSNETIAIIVQMGLSGVSTAVTNYENDLKATGYNVLKYSSNITDAKSLKNLLKGYYENNGLVGAVFIGKLPYVWFKDPAIGYNEIFECDMFFMDLDGNWIDTNSDGIYDVHNASSGADVHPEIYIGRIDASNRTLGTGQSSDISSLINRFHNYRKGNLNIEHKALMYIDDDWQGDANGTWNDWPAWLNNAYPNHDDIHTPTTWTNKSDWLNRLGNSSYEFAHLAVHTSSSSSGGKHYFGSGYAGSEGNITAAEIHNKGGGFAFYNLYCCWGADYNTSDCMGATYLFSGTYTQAVIGSTKSGGMINGAYFYDSLAENNTIGRALIDWLESNPNLDDINNQSWVYGMCILGDPFATIHYDCSVPKPTITSSTHTEDQWSTVKSLVRFNWTCYADLNGLDGSYYILDQNPNTIPTATTGIYTKINGTSFSNLDDGIWYLHVVAKDDLGNIGKRGDHFTLKIDTTGPDISLLTPTINHYSPTISVFISWDAVDEYNSLNPFCIFNRTGQSIYTGTTKNFTINGMIAGLNLFNITCTDSLMNPGILEISIFVDLIDPSVNVTSPLVNQTVENTFTITWEALDGESGIDHTEIYSDSKLIKTVDGNINSTTISGLTAGTHSINVTTYDKSGRSASQTISINVKPGENKIPGFPLGIFIIGSIFISIAYVISKKQELYK
ncbi:MAG: hypothetical protein BAJALOKI3v1_70004 [Promethearchaeota archaeon]|nr:MAG: hypothetical protein BAJALOKI3v1_70004 [Candidatus Lokiarchaeota archaeon]